MRSNYIFVIFLVLSILLHILLLAQFDLTPKTKPKSEPVSVSVIPKKKPKPQPAPQQKPEVKQNAPKEPIKNIPLDEKLDTKVDQFTPQPDVGKNTEEMKRKAENEEQAKRKAEKETKIKSMAEDKTPVEVPKIIPDEKFSKEQLEGILNPDDIIEKYATKGGEKEGEDSVSMQYVKLKYQSYFYKFARRLYQVWLYPKDAAYRGEHGTVRISFVISRDGMISSINIIQSSGYPDLDREAVTALKKTAGVPLPDSYKLNFLKVDAYFQYVLGGGFVVY